MIFTIDTGSEVTIIPEDLALSTGSDISSTEVNVNAYGGTQIPILGCLEDALVVSEGQAHQGLILIAKSGQRPILGMNFIRKFGLIPEISTPKICSPVTTEENSQFVASFRLKKDVSMVGMKCSPRSLPFSMKTHVETELRRLLAEDIIFPVENPVISAPIVPVVKQSGTRRPIRLCGDYSRTLNRIIDRDCYRLPTLEEILQKIAGAKCYSVLDLEDAFLQIQLSPESQLLTCISTHLGHFAYKRL